MARSPGSAATRQSPRERDARRRGVLRAAAIGDEAREVDAEPVADASSSSARSSLCSRPAARSSLHATHETLDGSPSEADTGLEVRRPQTEQTSRSDGSKSSTTSSGSAVDGSVADERRAATRMRGVCATLRSVRSMRPLPDAPTDDESSLCPAPSRGGNSSPGTKLCTAPPPPKTMGGRETGADSAVAGVSVFVVGVVACSRGGEGEADAGGSETTTTLAAPDEERDRGADRTRSRERAGDKPDRGLASAATCAASTAAAAPTDDVLGRSRSLARRLTLGDDAAPPCTGTACSPRFKERERARARRLRRREDDDRTPIEGLRLLDRDDAAALRGEEAAPLSAESVEPARADEGSGACDGRLDSPSERDRRRSATTLRAGEDRRRARPSGVTGSTLGGTRTRSDLGHPCTGSIVASTFQCGRSSRTACTDAGSRGVSGSCSPSPVATSVTAPSHCAAPRPVAGAPKKPAMALTSWAAGTVGQVRTVMWTVVLAPTATTVRDNS
mmetsp:Transcript_2195/g.6938  ORF Transcript_2195/g.6938 Transcript_2195/m.6938 type:complete len:503 (+) Transcript_2195:1568-3076(+)